MENRPFLLGHCHRRPYAARYTERARWIKPRRTDTLRSAFQRIVSPRSAHHQHPLQFSSRILATLLPAKLHTRVCIYILSPSKLSTRRRSPFRTCYRSGTEMFLFTRGDLREGIGEERSRVDELKLWQFFLTFLMFFFFL